MKLSPPQLEVLQKLAACDEPLVYFKGGYWTLPSIGHNVRTEHFGAAWYTTLGTVRALEKKGLLKQTNRATNYPLERYPQLADRMLSAQGLALASGCAAPMEGLVEAVVAWTGGYELHYNTFNVLDKHEWSLLIRKLKPEARADGLDAHDFSTNTAALTTSHQDIYVQAGHESDALHELVHASGLCPPDRSEENGFLCEGLTQSVTEEIARNLGLKIRKTYEPQVEYVRQYILPICQMSLKDACFDYRYGGIRTLVEGILDNQKNRAILYEKGYRDDWYRLLQSDLENGEKHVLASLLIEHLTPQGQP